MTEKESGFYIFSSFFILQWGWKRIFSALLAGAFSALAMPPFDLFPILFLTFPILVWLLDGAAADPVEGVISRIKPYFLVGWWFGFGYFLAGLWWIGSAFFVEIDQFIWALPLAIIGLPAVLAIFWGLATMLAGIVWGEDWRRIVILAALLGLAEYLRGTLFTGFPWNAIGYAAMTMPITMQSSSLIGLYAITTLAVLIFSLPALFAPGSGAKPRRLRAMLLVGLILVCSHVGFGIWRLQSHPTQFADGINLRLVQPAIPQSEKWLEEKESENFQTFINLSEEKNTNNNGPITHYIWPESAFPFLLTERRDALGAISQMLDKGSFLITGAARSDANGAANGAKAKIYNSVYVINHEGEIIGAADKHHLVPFGEYLPFQELAEALGMKQLAGKMGGFSTGASRTILSAGGTKFVPLICYEIIFPGAIFSDVRSNNSPGVSTVSSSQNLRRGANWMANLTNDAWFGLTTGPHQHARFARLRGVEEGLPVVRAANTGISFVSDAYGRILGRLELGARAKLDQALPAPGEITLYHQYRNLVFWLLTFVMIGAGLIRRR